MDPTGMGDQRNEKLEHYRAARDQIIKHMTDNWGAPVVSE
jgi:hypothetical protein